jgi:chaperonin GroEL
MRSRTLLYDLEARTKLKVGMDALSEMVKVTLGPKGNNVIIEKISGFPLITKDGVTVAREIYLSDPIENMGAQVLKEVAMKTNETAGDGTTTATVLAHAFITEGIKNLTAGSNPMDLKRGIDIAVKHVTDRLKELSRPVTGKEDIISVASISANNDNQIGNDIANSIEKAGNEGIVIVEDSKDSDTIIEVSEGMQIDRGYQHPYFINKTVTMEVELKGTYILFYNGKLHQMHDLARIAEAVIQKEAASFLVIADEFSQEVLQLLVMNKMKMGRQFCAVISPGFGDRKVDLLNDMAALTGGTVFGGDLSLPLARADISQLGYADKVLVDKNKTVIVGGKGKSEKVKERVDQIRMLLDNTIVDFDKQRLQERLGKLTGGIVVLRVGAITETELKEKKMRIEDALHATRAALDEGIVPGGGVALVRAKEIINKIDTSNLREDQKTGINIVKKALDIPFLSICSNAGLTGEVILQEVIQENLEYGYDSLNDKYGNMFEMGVIDPTKVVRLALENAASIAGLFLTTKGVIAESKEEKEYIDKLMSQSPAN